jgi:MFS family permease
MDKSDLRKLLSMPVIVAALGYFVDIYDLLLFSIVRVPSLKALGVEESMLLDTGGTLLTIQMLGLLIGGLIWGIMGDKKGRLSVLFGSILLYSLANIANGFVTTVDQYMWLRFIAGIGLAGELGAGITLVSEILPKHLRGYGTTLVATVGLLGAVLANFVAKTFAWETSFFIGGGLGLILLIARVSVIESGMFMQVKEQKKVDRGNFLMLFTSKGRLSRYLNCILIGLPIWFAIGILITFSPEFAKELQFPEAINAGDAVMYSYLGLAAGDLSSGVLSQWVKSRKKIVFVFILITLGCVVIYLFPPIKTTAFFYTICFFIGYGTGYWALFVTVAAEQFGTNLRSTVATTVPNFIRGTVGPIVYSFKVLRPEIGIIFAALTVGTVTVIIALISLWNLHETLGKDLNYVEED